MAKNGTDIGRLESLREFLLGLERMQQRGSELRLSILGWRLAIDRWIEALR